MSFLANAWRGLTRGFNCTPIQAHGLRTLATPQKVAENVEIPQITKEEDQQRREVFSNVNNLIKNGSTGRLFAVVQLCGKQFKITDGDIIIVEGHWPPTTGDRIRLDKVLLTACKDFTLLGRPILEPGLVDVQATVIEKTLSHTKTHFKKKRRKQYMRINFHRLYHTMVRINSIELRGLVNESKDESQKGAVRIF